jgi:hypothetical protein
VYRPGVSTLGKPLRILFTPCADVKFRSMGHAAVASIYTHAGGQVSARYEVRLVHFLSHLTSSQMKQLIPFVVKTAISSGNGDSAQVSIYRVFL